MYVRKKSCYIGEANVCSESMEKCKQNIAGGRLGPLVSKLKPQNPRCDTYVNVN